MKRASKIIVIILLVLATAGLVFDGFCCFALLSTIHSAEPVGIIVVIILFFPLFLIGSVIVAVISIISFLISLSARRKLSREPSTEKAYTNSLLFFKITLIYSLVCLILSVVSFVLLLLYLKLHNASST